jgi:protein-tyrosine-phosphatase
VLFVCTQNSARSQLAAAVWPEVGPVPAASAGTHPAGRVHPRAVATGRRHGLRIDPAATNALTSVVAAGDLIVCVCDNAHEELAAAGDAAIGVPVAGSIHWAVPDPVAVDTDEAFEHAYVEITGRVERLARALQATPARRSA